ncbi:hypothetical protein OC842_007517, partial [Tilletia horrida]
PAVKVGTRTGSELKAPRARSGRLRWSLGGKGSKRTGVGRRSGRSADADSSAVSSAGWRRHQLGTRRRAAARACRRGPSTAVLGSEVQPRRGACRHATLALALGASGRSPPTGGRRRRMRHRLRSDGRAQDIAGAGGVSITVHRRRRYGAGLSSRGRHRLSRLRRSSEE